MPDLYNKWHNHPYHSHTHWMVFVGASLVFSLFIVNAINSTYNLSYAQTTGTWTLLNSNSPPGTKDGLMTAYDGESQRIVMFGNHGPYDNTTWVYNISTNVWTQMFPSVSPSPRGHSDMVYDSVNDRMILFGGQTTGNGTNGETWAYDYNTNTWTNRNPATAPSPRWGYAMAYDAESAHTVIFGGYFYMEDITWAYNYSTNIWENRNATMNASCLASRPPAMHLQGMAYDSTNDRIIMFGQNSSIVYQTWAYDYNTNCWQLRGTTGQPTTAGQDEREMTYDSQSRLMVLESDTDETWTYDYATNTWTNQNPSPRPVVHHTGMAYIPSQNRIVLYGGRNAGGQAVETWQFTIGGGSGDTTPPTLSSGSPTGTLSAGTASATLSLITNEDATCRYSTTAGINYSSMTSTFSTTGGIAHSTSVSGLTNGTSYNYYVRCQDTAGNANASDYTISFSVAASTGAQILFQEDFEDTSLSTRGWYDILRLGTEFLQSTTERVNGNGSLEVRYGQGSTGPYMRHAVSPNQTQVYTRYYRKWAPNWLWPTVSGPHDTYLFSMQGQPLAPTDNWLTVYTDSLYYAAPAWQWGTIGLVYRKARQGNTSYQTQTSVYYPGFPPAFQLNRWYCIETLATMNTPGVPDGRLQVWVDGTQMYNINNAQLRDAGYPNLQFDVFMFGPYFHGGTTQVQSTWMDALVVATDRVGCLSAPPPADTTPPSTPTGFIAAAISSSQISLSWTASTDNVGITGYRVYRGGTQIATVTTGTSYSDTGLSPSTTYSYTVAAYDAAGNLSAQSVPVSATTPAAPPPPPPPPPPSSQACTHYVDQASGNDANTGTNETAPWRTLHRAVDGLPARERGGGAGTFTPVGPGSTVCVKNGTYTDITAALSGDPTPKYNPTNSGTLSSPIAFRAYTPATGSRHQPVVSRNLQGGNGTNNPVIGTAVRNYVIWDGFTLAPYTDVRIQSSSNITVENLLIDKGGTPSTGGTGNYDGIRVEEANDLVIRNNTIRNVYYTGDTHQNAACIKLYDTQNSRVYNNDLSNCNVGIYDKENGVSNIHELNYIHDIYYLAVLFNGFTSSRCGACPVQNNVVRNNVVVNALGGVNFGLADTARDGNMAVYNNTFYGVPLGIIEYTDLPGMRFYNNIINLNAVPSGFNNVSVKTNAVPSTANLLSDYTNYRAPSTPYAGFYTTGFETLTQWQSRGFDLNSITTDPLFVGPLAGTPPATAFQLQSSSPARNAGRVGGVSTGAPVNMGAYITGSEIIGVEGAMVPPPTDTTPPSTPTGLTATAISSSQINLSWTTSTDNVGVTGYRVYRAGVQIATPTTTSYSDTGLFPSTTYTYTVVAVDAAGNVSAQSSSVSATTTATTDTTPPTVSISSPTSDSTVSGTVTVSAIASDNVGVAGVQFLLNGLNLGTEDTASPYSVSWNTVTAANGFHTLTARARDSAGNTTTSSVVIVMVSNVTLDTTTPTIASWDVQPRTTTSLFTVSWNVTDSGGSYLNRVEIQRAPYDSVNCNDTTKIGCAWNQATSVNAPLNSNSWISSTTDNPAALGTYWYRTHVLDNAGNRTTEPSPVRATIAATSTKFSIGNRIYVSAGLLNVRSTASLSGTLLGTQATNNQGVVVGGPTLADGFWWWQIDYDVTPDGWSVENYLENVVPDTTSPSTPTNLTATTISSSQINLSWTASTDNVGVTGYRVERCQGTSCTNFVQVTTPTSNNYSDTGLSANTTYSYRVRAVDASGNLSSYSSITNATTQSIPVSDIIPPTISLTAPLGGITVSGTVNMTATASDNVGVSIVEFYVDGILKGSDILSPHEYSWDTTNEGTHPCNGTHTHSLTTRAYDAANNVGISSPITVNMNDPSYCTPTPPPSTKFLIGDRVETTSNLNVRATASVTGTLLGTQTTGALGSIIGGPTYADGFHWWNINYDSGPDGWSVEDFLIKIVVAPTPPPPPSPTLAPVISNLAVSVKKGEARFSWTTDKLADSQIEYGSTTAYGLQSALNPNLVISHEISISNLTLGSYNARALSTASSILGLSNNIEFIVRGKPLKITLITVSPGSIILNWGTPSFPGYAGVVILRSTTGYFNDYDLSFEIARVTGTTYTDDNVVTGTTYYYSLFVFDDQENYSDPANVSFIAPTPTSTPTPTPTPPLSSGGGSSGGGSSVSAPSAPPTASVSLLLPTNFSSLTQAQKITVLSAKIVELQTLMNSLIQAGQLPVSTSSCLFTRDLHLDSIGEDVRCLQKYLNTQGFIISPAGLGAFGSESNYFGEKTKAAVLRWQQANNITPFAGYFGPKSRGKYLELK